MTTVSDVINLAFKDCGALGETEAASAEMTVDGFETFQQMMSLWQADNLNVYAQVESSFSPTGAASYTVGTGGTVAITRPDKIDYAFWRSGTTDIPITILNAYEDYEGIVDKSLSTDPSYLYYLPSYPLGTLYLFPKPSTGTVHLVRQERLPLLTAVTDTITLPPQYILPIRYSLAEIFLMMFDLPNKPLIPMLAARARSVLRKQNVRINELGMPVAIPQHQRNNIITGY